MVDVKVHAPVMLIPTSQQSTQGIMVDLGSVAVQNTLLIPDKSANNIGIDAYGITLNAFKISRWVNKLYPYTCSFRMKGWQRVWLKCLKVVLGNRGPTYLSALVIC